MEKQTAKPKKKALDLDQAIIWDTLVKLATLVFLLGDEALAAAIFLFSVCLKEQGPEETLKDLNPTQDVNWTDAECMERVEHVIGNSYHLSRIDGDITRLTSLTLASVSGLFASERPNEALAFLRFAYFVGEKDVSSEDIISLLSAGDASMTVDHILKAAQLKAPDLEEQLVSMDTGLVDPAGNKLN